MTSSTLNNWMPTYRNVGNTATTSACTISTVWNATDTIFGDYTTTVDRTAWTKWVGNGGTLLAFMDDIPDMDVPEDEIDQSEELCGFLEEISE